MILHTCDTGGASSGSPLLVETAQGPVVAGINVGTYVQSKVVMQNGQVTHRQRAETVANTAVNASAFADRVGILRTAHILASGNPMKTLQERLRQQQFYAGRIDGNLRPGAAHGDRGLREGQHAAGDGTGHAGAVAAALGPADAGCGDAPGAAAAGAAQRCETVAG